MGVLTSPTSYSSTLANTTFTASDINLAANSTYWVVLEAQSGEFDWSWIASNTGTGIGFQNTWGNSNDAGATWFIYNIYPTQMRVSIASSSVPEPGPIILCSACAAASLLLRAMFRRHSRADDAAGTVQE